MAWFQTRRGLVEAVESWKQRDLIDQATATRLVEDITRGAGSRGFPQIAVLLGVVLLAFGVVTFVAANWQEMTSLQRVVLLFAAMWAAWGLSMLAGWYGKAWTAGVLVMLSCAIFGASIMLLGQIYHLQGNAKDAVWLWAVGTLAAALMTRTVPALVLSIALLALWAVMDRAGTWLLEGAPDLSFVAYWAIAAVGAWWMGSRLSAHSLMIALNIWLFQGLTYWTSGLSVSGTRPLDLAPVALFLVAAFGGMAILLHSAGRPRWLRGFELPALIHVAILAAACLLLWYFESDRKLVRPWPEPTVAAWLAAVAAMATLAGASFAWLRRDANRYDIAVAAVLAVLVLPLAQFGVGRTFALEAFMLAVAMWTIRMGLRLEYRPLSMAGYLGFAGLLLLIYAATVGTLFDTSLFYLGAGAILIAIAVILPRLARRSAAP